MHSHRDAAIPGDDESPSPPARHETPLVKEVDHVSPVALDAPTASLPLINSLTHLSYLTATSPRVREILAGDGGLERLVRILQQCAEGGAASATGTGSDESTTTAPVKKGKGKVVERRRLSRKSPFKPFAEYSPVPTLADVQLCEELGLALRASAVAAAASLPPFSVPPSLALPAPNKQRSLLHTYSLAFQCIVNIGVRGSEAIRTRVVEAGALEVVVFVLERYLEDVERRRSEALAQLERQRQLEMEISTSLAASNAMDVEAQEDEDRDALAVGLADASVSFISTTLPPQISLPPTAVASLPLLTRVNVVAASNSALGVGSSSSNSTTTNGLQLPSRVQTPDTVLSMDDASVTCDENGSASGADAEGDEVSMPSSSAASSTSAVAAPIPRCVAASALAGAAKSVRHGSDDSQDDVEMRDVDPSRDGQNPAAPAATATAGEAETSQAGVPSSTRTSRPALPRLRSQPEPLPSYAPRASDSSTAPSPVSHGSPHVRSTAPSSHATVGRSSAAAGDGSLRFRDEDVLLSLQLLAYLSKYPHVRAIFHSSAVANVPRPRAHAHAHSHSSRPSPVATASTTAPMNIFSLVEAFTFKPASDDILTPRHSSEVQYWAGVIMRNACRKDDARGGIRQCANMRCVKWEQYAREFAKCRRCRRAKYCSKACQSEAWTQGHRYWCHKVASRRGETGEILSRSSAALDAAGASATSSPAIASSGAEGLPTPRGDEPLPTRRRHHHHHHHRHHAGQGQSAHAHRRHRSAEEDDEDEEDFPPPPSTTTAMHGHDAGATPRAHAQRLPAAAPQFDLGDAEIGPTQTGLVPGVDEDHLAREMLRAADGTGIGIGLGDNFDGIVRVQAT